MDIYFTDKSENGFSVMNNVHSLYGTIETIATQYIYSQSLQTEPSFYQETV